MNHLKKYKIPSDAYDIKINGMSIQLNPEANVLLVDFYSPDMLAIYQEKGLQDATGKFKTVQSFGRDRKIELKISEYGDKLMKILAANGFEEVQ